jgi:hypothetical protein
MPLLQKTSEVLMNTFLNKLNSGDTLVAGSDVYQKQDNGHVETKDEKKEETLWN